MPFIPHTSDDVAHMLAVIGAPSIDALFDEIPAALKAKPLDGVPPALCEMDMARLVTERAAGDGRRHGRSGRDRLQRNVAKPGTFEEAHVHSIIWLGADIERRGSQA